MGIVPPRLILLPRCKDGVVLKDEHPSVYSDMPKPADDMSYHEGQSNRALLTLMKSIEQRIQERAEVPISCVDYRLIGEEYC